MYIAPGSVPVAGADRDRIKLGQSDDLSHIGLYWGGEGHNFAARLGNRDIARGDITVAAEQRIE
jgi:hypothetical protein